MIWTISKLQNLIKDYFTDPNFASVKILSPTQLRITTPDKSVFTLTIEQKAPKS